MTTTVYRPGLNVIQTNGSTSFYDDDGNVRQVIGVQGDGTVGVTQLNGAAPPAPSLPTVTASALELVVGWDGNLVSTIPMDFDHVEIHVSTTNGFTPSSGTLQGTLRHAGIFPVTPLIAATPYYVKLVGVNTSAVSGSASAQATGTPTAIIATSADFTARDIGGITTTVATVAPTGALQSDIWIDTANGNRVNQYNGSAWVAYQWNTGAFAAESVTADIIGAGEVLAGNIGAGEVDTTHLAANSVTADKLAAVLLIASQIIAGTQTGTRVQIDASGIAAYDQDGNATVVIGSDGNAAFSGASVSAIEVDAERMLINSPTDGGLFMYSSAATPLNANPDFATSTAGWTATATTVTYSSVHTYNGHNTMRCQRTGGAATVETSPAVVVVPGTQYQIAANMLSSDGTPMYAQIRWLDSGGTQISTVTSPANASTTFAGGLVVVAGIAPAGAATAVIRLGFTITTTGAFYVGHAGLTATNIFSSLTNNAGTDDFGNAYPAGLRTAAANIGTLTAGNINWGASTAATNSSGQVVISHGLGHDPNTIQITPTAGAAHRPYVASHSATTITVGFKDASDTIVTVGGQGANFYWLAAV